MNIGIDLDSTLIKIKAIEIASEKLGMRYTEEDNLDWNLSVFPDNLRNLIFSLFSDPHIMCDNVEPLEGAQEKLKNWVNEGHKLHIITARNPEIHIKTYLMVKRFFPEVLSLSFVNMGETKIHKMEKLRLDVWIDDAVSGISDAKKLKIKNIFLISNKYTKYNHDIADYYRNNEKENIKIVKAVKDIEL